MGAERIALTIDIKTIAKYSDVSLAQWRSRFFHGTQVRKQ
jgi:hypothetical protein